MVDVGDYVQLHIPNSLAADALNHNDTTSDRVMEETQKVFDETVSKHIDMRDHLESMKEKFRSVAIGDDGGIETGTSEEAARIDHLLTTVEEKEREIRKMHDLQRLRRLKPSFETLQARREAEEAQAKIAMLEKEVDSLTRQLETKERERMDAEARTRLAQVEHLRQERKMKEAAEYTKGHTPGMENDDKVPVGIPGGAREQVEQDHDTVSEESNLRRSQSSPYINRTPEEPEPPSMPIFQQPSSYVPPKPAPVPDRSTKPTIG